MIQGSFVSKVIAGKLICANGIWVLILGNPDEYENVRHSMLPVSYESATRIIDELVLENTEEVTVSCDDK